MRTGDVWASETGRASGAVRRALPRPIVPHPEAIAARLPGEKENRMLIEVKMKEMSEVGDF
ncbi:hypothetical protein PUN4_930007 [Paraburkholderia unamae]|nr:hypothetical protein PUN4_930007 [Paraburkholderia unamae]